MRVLFVTSELYPLVKTGGLADVSAALPAALADDGIDIRVILPGYSQALEGTDRLGVPIRLGNILGAGDVQLVPGATPDTGLPVWLVDCPALFRRPGGPYQDMNGRDWPDNDIRFAVLCHAAARLAGGLPELAWRPDVVHANDWHAGPVPLLVRRFPSPRPGTVFTIHNLAFQGLFPPERLGQLNITPDDASAESLEFYGQVSFIKAGIAFADRLTTVSSTYASEIQGPEFGCGLEGLLRARASHLSGIMNGVDYAVWDPAGDPHIPHRFTAGDLGAKRRCKAELQRELDLEMVDLPLIAFMSRITEQKMADVVLEALPGLCGAGAQFVLLGDGDRALEARFVEAGAQHPGRVSVRIGYEEQLARRILAGADILLHPSRFEPCGLVPLYAMRYGTIPIVRNVGGLADSVFDARADALAVDGATGFVFADTSATDLLGSVHRALATYHQPVTWRRLQRRAMAQDFSWRGPAQRYHTLYRDVAKIGGMEDPMLSGIDRAVARSVDSTELAGRPTVQPSQARRTRALRA